MRTNRATLYVLVSAILLPTTLRAGGASKDASEAVRNGGRAANLPRMRSGLPPALRLKLSRAFYVAMDRLHSNEECRRLFEELDAEGTTALARTLYVRPMVGEEKFCSGVHAFTTVGGPVTRVCRSFDHTRLRQAAMVLIHEALHTAGAGEKPSDPRALSSAQINELVRRRCSL